MASDVAFSNCDFSNSTFSQANFTRCTFSSCKFTGADLLEAVLSRVEVRDSSFAYASVAKGKLEDVSVRSTDFPALTWPSCDSAASNSRRALRGH